MRITSDSIRRQPSATDTLPLGADNRGGGTSGALPTDGILQIGSTTEIRANAIIVIDPDWYEQVVDSGAALRAPGTI